jgi:hypothetical protein
VPREWSVFGRVFKDYVFNPDVTGSGIAAHKVELLFVSRNLARISDVQHGGNGSIRLEGPTPPRK